MATKVIYRFTLPNGGTVERRSSHLVVVRCQLENRGYESWSVVHETNDSSDAESVRSILSLGNTVRVVSGSPIRLS